MRFAGIRSVGGPLSIKSNVPLSINAFNDALIAFFQSMFWQKAINELSQLLQLLSGGKVFPSECGVLQNTQTPLAISSEGSTSDFCSPERLLAEQSALFIITSVASYFCLAAGFVNTA